MQEWAERILAKVKAKCLHIDGEDHARQSGGVKSTWAWKGASPAGARTSLTSYSQFLNLPAMPTASLGSAFWGPGEMASSPRRHGPGSARRVQLHSPASSPGLARPSPAAHSGFLPLPVRMQTPRDGSALGGTEGAGLAPPRSGRRMRRPADRVKATPACTLGPRHKASRVSAVSIRSKIYETSHRTSNFLWATARLTSKSPKPAWEVITPSRSQTGASATENPLLSMPPNPNQVFSAHREYGPAKDTTMTWFCLERALPLHPLPLWISSSSHSLRGQRETQLIIRETWPPGCRAVCPGDVPPGRSATPHPLARLRACRVSGLDGVEQPPCSYPGTHGFVELLSKNRGLHLQVLGGSETVGKNKLKAYCTFSPTGFHGCHAEPPWKGGREICLSLPCSVKHPEPRLPPPLSSLCEHACCNRGAFGCKVRARSGLRKTNSRKASRAVSCPRRSRRPSQPEPRHWGAKCFMVGVKKAGF